MLSYTDGVVSCTTLSATLFLLLYSFACSAWPLWENGAFVGAVGSQTIKKVAVLLTNVFWMFCTQWFLDKFTHGLVSAHDYWKKIKKYIYSSSLVLYCFCIVDFFLSVSMGLGIWMDRWYKSLYFAPNVTATNTAAYEIGNCTFLIMNVKLDKGKVYKP